MWLASEFRDFLEPSVNLEMCSLTSWRGMLDCDFALACACDMLHYVFLNLHCAAQVLSVWQKLLNVDPKNSQTFLCDPPLFFFSIALLPLFWALLNSRLLEEMVSRSRASAGLRHRPACRMASACPFLPTRKALHT